MKQEIWAIVLAAGKSTRMGKQKLLLPYDNETIIGRVIRTAALAANGNVMVVLGSHSMEVREQAGNNKIKFCFNAAYESGMLSSVICGFDALPENAEATILFLGDQPQIPDTVPGQITEAWKNSGKGIVLPCYAGKRGHPVLIETRYKNEIKQLDPDKGLKGLMQKFSDDVYEAPCNSPEITRDIDTPADYNYEINKNN